MTSPPMASTSPMRPSQFAQSGMGDEHLSRGRAPCRPAEHGALARLHLWLLHRRSVENSPALSLERLRNS
jgi:hypothetical protein